MVEPSRVQLARPWVGEEESRLLAETLAEGWFGAGPRVGSFEARVGTLLGGSHVVAAASGTAAIQLALEGAGIGHGDEVIVPSLTFCATVQAVLGAGATPVFAEVDDQMLCLDPRDLERCTTPATRAVLPVHFGGHVAASDEIDAHARRHGLVVVEDAAHAFGSVHPDGRSVGTAYGAACFSFDPIKAITCGQGGAVAVAHSELAASIRARSNLGLRPGAHHVVDGVGHRLQMGDLNAAIGLAQLDRWATIVARRRALWIRYRDGVAAIDGAEGLAHDVDRMVPFFYVVKVDPRRRAKIRAALDGEGIDTGIHYAPNHLQPGFARWKSSLPVTERLGGEILTLPFHTGLEIDDVDRVLSALAGSLR